MTLSVTQTNQNGTTSSVNSLTSTFGSTTAGGSLLVVLVDARLAASVNTPTDTAGNAYLQAGTEFTGYGNNAYTIWYCANATANAGTVTVTFSSSTTYRSIVIYEIAGAATSSVLDTTKSGAGTGTAIASGSFTISTSEIIVAILGNDNASTITPGTGYALVQYNATGDTNKYFAHESHVTSSTETASATNGASTNWGIFAAAFKAASGGGSTFNPGWATGATRIIGGAFQ